MKRTLTATILTLVLALSTPAQQPLHNYCLGDVTVTASSTSANANYSPSGAVDGDRKGHGWQSGGGWNDASKNAFPDFFTVDFGRVRSMGRVVVVSLQNNFGSPVEPTPTMTAEFYGLVDYDVEILDLAGVWQTAAQVRGNDKVMNELAFAPIRGTQLRVKILATRDGFSRLVEVEAYSR